MTLQVDIFSGLETFQFLTQYERRSLAALQGIVQSSLTLFITLKGTHRLGIVVDCHGIVKKYSPLVFYVVVKDRVRKCIGESLRYSEIFLETFCHFFNLLIFEVKLFTVNPRQFHVVTELAFSFLNTGFDSLVHIMGRKPPECENSDDMVPELGAQDVLQSSQLFLNILAKRARQSRSVIIIKY